LDYVLADGKPFCSVARWDLPEGKEIRQFHNNGAGVEWTRPDGQAPLLYIRDLLNSGPPVLVVAGEKTADAAKRLFPGWCVTTSLGGESAALKSTRGQTSLEFMQASSTRRCATSPDSRRGRDWRWRSDQSWQ
jgi:hypothetical protein